ncbi:MAG: tRNA (adenosine(37)-N6)-threonylcarbamoyltransferase complex ATPase subunit type 1 TsaE [Nitrospira sp.]|nr:tRNA (adenosine(37)-N6)-threonylcarbamoyltransferase complex ATPase subunit type 1 TsaE [Nitrospira sp.]
MPSPKPRRLSATSGPRDSRAGRSTSDTRAAPLSAKPEGRTSDQPPLSAGAWRTVTRSAAETERLGRATGQALRGGETLALYGELGSGKTVFVRGLAAGLGAPSRAVSSPTFVLIHEYPGRLRLVHADFYRIEQESDLRHLGLPDYQDGLTVMAIEWAEKAGTELPQDRLEIRLDHLTATSRTIVMHAIGPSARACLTRMTTPAKIARDPVPVGRKKRPRR